MTPDSRPLSTRIKVLADQETARAIGLEKTSVGGAARVAYMYAAWLNEAVAVLRSVGR